MIRVTDPGVYTTVQDQGRPGFSALGVPRGGAADPLSLRAANRAVGNPDDAAGLEMTMIGGRYAFDGPARVAVVAGGAEISIAGAPVPEGEPQIVGAGQEVRVGRITRGFRAYLAVRGGVEVPRVFGSSSTNPSSAFGGVAGRPLRAEDVLPVGGVVAPERPVDRAWRTALSEGWDRRVLRAVDGPHAAGFGAAGEFWNGSFTVTSRSDRAGLRLAGPKVTGGGTGRMVSEGMMVGAVQVPPDGHPIILMPDGPTTGGYPVVAVVAGVDLATLGQLPPNAAVRFERVTVEGARALWAARERLLEGEA